MSEGHGPNPIMMIMMAQSAFVGPAERVENTIMPVDAQLNFGPGDVAVLAMANTPLERDFVIVKCLDPAKHAKTFPDWEERLYNSMVLCELFSRADNQLSIGWISRLKLFPISKYRYRQARKWLKEGFPEETPEWVEGVYLKMTDALADQAPDVVPRVVQCPACQSREVAIVVERMIKYSAKAGELVIDGEDKYVPITSVEEENTHIARLRCQECNTYADMSDEEWTLPDLSN